MESIQLSFIRLLIKIVEIIQDISIAGWAARSEVFIR